jgi:hypothetical protein
MLKSCRSMCKVRATSSHIHALVFLDSEPEAEDLDGRRNCMAVMLVRRPAMMESLNNTFPEKSGKDQEWNLDKFHGVN